jgi:hypothetical protein
MNPPAASLNPRLGALAPSALPGLSCWVAVLAGVTPLTEGMELESSSAGWVLT